MNTVLFKYAVEVERTRSISRAAKNLMMAQPNLSKAIKELEESLGFAIFDRTPKGVTPTGKGNVFLDYARSILSQVDSIKALSASSDKNIQKFSITVSRGSYVSSGIVNFASGLDAETGLDMDIRETSSMEAMNNVISGRYNLGIIRYRAIYEQYFSDFLSLHRICSAPIWEFQAVALMSSHHRLANEPSIKPEDLLDYTEIVHGDTVIPYLSAQADTSRRSDAAVTRQIRLYERCNQFELLNHMPSTYMWGSPLPEDMLRRYDLVQRRCDFPDNRYKDLLIYPDGYHFTTLEKRFIDEINAARDKVSEQQYQ
jgi:DNA-binding transcriptional LysR family regulator